jgi:quercetin dioxygenase-like cupin family protein
MDDVSLPPAPGAVVVRSADGELIPAAGVDHLFKLTGRDTSGRLGLERFHLPPGVVGARPHVHRAHDESFYVLSGSLTVATDDGDVVLGPGDLAHAPRGALHGFRNASDVAVHALCLYTPPGYEQYFRDVHAAVAAGAELTVDLLAELRSHYATESR